MSKKLIVFVCVSNTCRSPMCEHLFRKSLQELQIEDRYEVISRSLTTFYEPEGSPASPQGIEVMQKDFGVDMSKHSSKLLQQDDVDQAFLIIPVKMNLREDILTKFPGAKDKFAFFKRDIQDPWHQPVEVYRFCAHMIIDQFNPILEKLIIDKN